jgi:diaminopimelate decarboxylase
MNPFKTLGAQQARELAKRFDTPLYIMSEEAILARFQDFDRLAKSKYSRSIVSVSYKTNPLQYLLARLHEHGAYAEVVSGVEYTLAKNLGVRDSHIIFNGPLKTDAELQQAVVSGAIINCDHAEEIFRIEAIAQHLDKPVAIGLRVCFEDLGIHWNRFGFFINDGDEGLFAVIKQIVASPHLQLKGLHAHIGTNIRDMSQFSLLAKRLSELAWQIKQQHAIYLDWIDVGGGLAGISPRIDENQLTPHPLPSLEDYLTAVISPLREYLTAAKARLFFEPGRTLFEPFGALLTKVVSRRPGFEAGSNGLILDAGINALPSAQVYNHPVCSWRQDQKQALTYFFGPTCNQVDQLHQPTVMAALKREDLLLFCGVGAYGMSFSYNFIRYRPGVIVWSRDNSAHWIRQRETLAFLSALEITASES